LIINLDVLEKKFKEGEKVNPKILLEKGLLKKEGNKRLEVKILGDGEISKPLIISGCKYSKAAKEKIEKAGGKII